MSILGNMCSNSGTVFISRIFRGMYMTDKNKKPTLSRQTFAYDKGVILPHMDKNFWVSLARGSITLPQMKILTGAIKGGSNDT